MAVRVNMRLTERQSKVLRLEAERRGLSLSELMRRIMDAWLEKLTDGGGS
jgi:predicted HicB family RNase H-like nuclease